jgi:hypothetical protein
VSPFFASKERRGIVCRFSLCTSLSLELEFLSFCITDFKMRIRVVDKKKGSYITGMRFAEGNKIRKKKPQDYTDSSLA